MTETKQKRKPRKYTDEFKQQLVDLLDYSQEKRHDFGNFLGRLVLPSPIIVFNLCRGQIP